VLDSAIRQGDRKVFAAHLNQVDSYEIAELRLGKRTEELHAEAEKLHKQITPHAYGPPPIRFTEADVDQARAAGVVIEFERAAPIIVDRPLYRELVKSAVKCTVHQLQAKAAEIAEQKALERKRSSGAPVDPVAEAVRERDRQLREPADQAHGVNLDLGTGLLNGLSVVDPADPDVARFFVFALLGADHDASPYAQTGERIHHLAVAGIRLVIDELRADVTKTLKDGSRGRLRIDYGDPKQPEPALKWLWRYVDGAKSAGLYGRALVVIAAEQYAARLVLPASQRTYRAHWGSHKDLAAKALRKLAGPHLPASLKQLERAVARANKQAEDAQHSRPKITSDQSADAGSVENESPGRDAVDEDVEDVADVEGVDEDVECVDADESDEAAAGE
jgi:hypothetical protein